MPRCVVAMAVLRGTRGKRREEFMKTSHCVDGSTSPRGTPSCRDVAFPHQNSVEVRVDGDLYNTIGRDYSLGRRAEPAWERVIASYLTDRDVLVNVGAGTGSYEPDDIMVIAIEPSSAMLDQRSPGSARAIQGRAEMLPLRDVSADCAMTILSR